MAKRIVSRRKTTPPKPTKKELEKLVENVEAAAATKVPAPTNPLIDSAGIHATISNINHVMTLLNFVDIDGASDSAKAGLHFIRVWLSDTLKYAEVAARRAEEAQRAIIAALDGGLRP